MRSIQAASCPGQGAALTPGGHLSDARLGEGAEVVHEQVFPIGPFEREGFGDGVDHARRARVLREALVAAIGMQMADMADEILGARRWQMPQFGRSAMLRTTLRF